MTTEASVLFLRSHATDHIPIEERSWWATIKRNTIFFPDWWRLAPESLAERVTRVARREHCKIRQLYLDAVPPAGPIGIPVPTTNPEGYWKTVMTEHSHRADFILVHEGWCTAGLAWELKFLREEWGRSTRLFILTHPTTRLFDWQEYRASLAAIDIEVGEDPGAGSVVTFRDWDHPEVLLKGSFFADRAWLLAIRRWIANDP